MPDEATITLEPPPATESETAAAKTAMQEAFDRVAPLKKPVKAQEHKPVETVKPPVEQPKPAPEPDVKPVAEQKLPSFVIGEKPKEEIPKEPEIKLDDLPKEAPADASEKTKIDWRKARTLIDKQDAELKALREKQDQRQEKGKELSSVDAARIKELEQKTAQYEDQLKRYGLQQDPTFISQVIQPLRATYGEAKRIIKEAGGNPEQLDKALMLTGKDHYSAMDEILGEFPESAKGELTGVMRDYRRYAVARAEAVANAPKVYEELQKQNLVNQKQFFENQKGEMEKRFEDRIKFLREQAHLETLMESKEEGTEWWNEIPKKVTSTARMIALENQDMDVVMDASILAASAISYRDMYHKEREGRVKAETELRQIKGAEPRITDSGNGDRPSSSKKEELLKLSPGKAFLEILKKQNA